MTDKLAFREPSNDDAAAGYATYKRSKSPYERFMDEEGLPVFRGIGVPDTRALPLGPWPRLGGRGSYLHLDGLEGEKGLFVVEVPAGGALQAERHIYDEFFLVIEGRGSTEVWREGHVKRQAFEWQPGSLFRVPTNAWHRLVNAASSPAVLLAATNAPGIFNTFQSPRFIFENPYDFVERYDGNDDFFRPRTELEADPVRGRAAMRSNVFPDIFGCELPLDNQRAPGYRRVQPLFEGYVFHQSVGGHIGEFPTGRYSKAHYHASGLVLVCLRGRGVTFNWPVDAGPRPWASGKAELVKVCEYGPGGLVAAAPGGGYWFHQHFGVGAEPLRLLNFWGGPTARWGVAEEKDDEMKTPSIHGINEGGRTIHYKDEDPYIRWFYAARLREVGLDSQMPDSLFA